MVISQSFLYMHCIDRLLTFKLASSPMMGDGQRFLSKKGQTYGGIQLGPDKRRERKVIFVTNS